MRKGRPDALIEPADLQIEKALQACAGVTRSGSFGRALLLRSQGDETLIER